MTLTDEEAIELIEQYFAEEERTISEIVSMRTDELDGRIMKIFSIRLEDQEGYIMITIDDSGNIEERGLW